METTKQPVTVSQRRPTATWVFFVTTIVFLTLVFLECQREEALFVRIGRHLLVKLNKTTMSEETGEGESNWREEEDAKSRRSSSEREETRSSGNSFPRHSSRGVKKRLETSTTGLSHRDLIPSEVSASFLTRLDPIAIATPSPAVPVTVTIETTVTVTVTPTATKSVRAISTGSVQTKRENVASKTVAANPKTVAADSKTVATIPKTALTSRKTTPATPKQVVDGFDVYTEGCKIPHLDPFDSSIRRIIKIGPKLSKCKGKEGHVFEKFPEEGKIQLKATVAEEFRISSCEAEVAIRSEDSENTLSWGKPDPFLSTEKYSVKGDVTRVRCKNVKGKSVIIDYIPMPHRSQPKLAQKQKHAQEHRFKKQPKERPNVLMIGLDATSRHNFVRQLPRTRDFLLRNLSAIELMGYNKLADNTFVNLVPVLSGKYLVDLPWTSKMKDDPFDNQPLIWKNFSQQGYWTFYAEDNPSISTFNYLKRGFSKQPTDHYYRTMALALRHSGWEKDDCYGSLHEDEWVYEWLLNGLQAHKNDPKFALVWLNQWTHNYLNSAGYADQPTLSLLQAMKKQGHLENTVLLLLSDHGQRWGDIRQTFIGKFEERMPFFYVVLPESWRQKYPEKWRNVEKNAKKLTTNFDVYETLLDLLNFGVDDEAERLSSSNPPISKDGVRFRYSLFSEIPETRNCESATVLPHWCICQSEESVQTEDEVVRVIAKIIVDKVNDELKDEAAICHKLSLATIKSAYRTKTEEKLLRFKESHDDVNPKAELGRKSLDTRNYLVTIETSPGGGIFEATVRVNEKWEKQVRAKAKSESESQNVRVEGTVSRLNLYGNTSWCMKDAKLRLYCYCKQQIPSGTNPRS